MSDYLKLIRPHHYIKNLLVFAALVCSGQLFDAKKLTAAVFGFLAFCMASSAVYVINDIRDRARDAVHPTKCDRPIASGRVTVRSAAVLCSVLFVLCAVFNCLSFGLISTLLLGLYVILNIAYSMGLKNIPLLDVTILVAGFLIRVLYGAKLCDIEVSGWLYLTVVAFSFYLALGKRRNELKRLGGDDTRAVLRHYSMDFLDKNMYMCLALANAFYALWSMDSATVATYGGRNLVFSAPLVLIITMKYSLSVEGCSDGDPVEVLIHDRVLCVLCAVYVAVMLCLLYL